MKIKKNYMYINYRGKKIHVYYGNVLKSSLRKFYGRYGDLVKHYEVSLSQMLHGMIIYSYTLHRSGISPNRELIIELDLITVFDVITSFREVSKRHSKRVRLVNGGRLLFRTPGPVQFETCICSDVETILSWTCYVYGPIEFRASLGTSRSILSTILKNLQITFQLLTQGYRYHKLRKHF